MSNNKQSMKLYTEEQVKNSMNSMKTYIEKYNENVIDKIIENHIRALGGIETKRTIIIYNTKETTEDEARHLLEILNCDDSTLWDNADHCGVQVLEVPIQGGNNKQSMTLQKFANYAKEALEEYGLNEDRIDIMAGVYNGKDFWYTIQCWDSKTRKHIRSSQPNPSSSLVEFKDKLKAHFKDYSQEVKDIEL